MRASPTAELGDSFAVVAHDAGAANLILAWLDPVNPPRAMMEGPAANLWRARMGNAPLVTSIEQLLDGTNILLSGTGWASDLEHRARIAARRKGILSVAVIDHWTNYRVRFERSGQAVLPDEIWVTDLHAEQLAHAEFAVRIALQPNAYLAEQLAAIGRPIDPSATLYVLEPARSDWGRGRAGEFQALDYFMAHRALIGIGPDDPVLIRPHPSDPPGKYHAWLGDHAQARLDESTTLAEAISAAGYVVGAQTNAMVVALAAGRTVVCTLPPWAPPCVLPQTGIIRLAELAGSAR